MFDYVGSIGGLRALNAVNVFFLRIMLYHTIYSCAYPTNQDSNTYKPSRNVTVIENKKMYTNKCENITKLLLGWQLNNCGFC